MDTGFLGIGFLEFLLIAAIALVIIGPDRLPEYARKFGKLVRDFRRMTTNMSGEMKKAIDFESEAAELKKTASGITTMLNEEARAIGSSLDADASEISRTMGIEIDKVKKTMSESTSELSDILKREATSVKTSAEDVKSALDREFGELTRTLSEGKKKLDKALGVEDAKPAPAEAPAPVASGQPAGPAAPKPPKTPQPASPDAPVSASGPVSTNQEGGSKAA